MEYINSKEELNKILKEEKVLVDFFATWCGPCQMLGPVLEEISKEVPGLSIVKVDVDKNPDLAKEHGILSIPVLEYYKNGKLVDKALGYMSKEEIKDFLN